MNDPTLTCRDERRRGQARERNFNGIDNVEVGADQTTLCVHLFGDVPREIDKANVRVEGGRRVRDIRVIAVSAEPEDDPELGECLRVVVDRPGDFSTYKLCLVETENGRPTDRPYPGFDPRYACVEFSFKVDYPSELDCRTEPICPPDKHSAMEINYFAKDYAGFRQLLFDRLALLLPDWRERHVPDIGVALVELLAYAGDHLSYYQDAVATEAYLDTARQRISVRRHARLVDYQMHEGCNARAFLFVETDGDVALTPTEIFFVTNCAELERAGGRTLSAEKFKQLNIPESHYDVFEPLVENSVKSIQLSAAHNSISFYTWGDAECCLPRGATRATLKDEIKPNASTTDDVTEKPDDKQAEKPNYRQSAHAPKPPATDTPPVKEHRALNLNKGDVLIFEEVKDPKTNDPADADPAQRHAVRLTKVEPGHDSLLNQPIIEIEWMEEDALPFALCLSAVRPAPDCDLIEEISIARGNIIMVDHGRTISPERLGQVPVKTSGGECACGTVEMTTVAGKFQPALTYAPLTFSQPLDAQLPASAVLRQDPRRALPQITKLHGLPETSPAASEMNAAAPERLLGDHNPNDSVWQWSAQRDLLCSQSTDRHFVAEIDNDGRAHLRFGDGASGSQPAAGTNFNATYRVGNGTDGNAGPDTITHLIFRRGRPGSLQPRNPLPAQSGVESEPLVNVKLFASGAIRRDVQRAITADDYARLAERSSRVQRAAAELRWTGSWHEARIAVDPRGSAEIEGSLLGDITGHLYPYRRVGHDVLVVPARYVPLEIELTVCVLPHYQRGQVKAALLDAFSNRLLPDGQRGFFHPDNLTFGEGVYLSQLLAAAQSVAGVESVTVTKLQRSFAGPNDEIENGILQLEAMEIARLDNDPSFPEHGTLKIC